MSKEDIEKMQTELNILVDKMNKIIDDDIYGSKRTYYQYKIEILKRDIMIAKLQYMLTFEKSLEPLPPIFIKQPLTELRDEIIAEFTQHYKHHLEQYNLEIELNEKGLYIKNHQYIIRYENGKLIQNKYYYKNWDTPKRYKLLGTYFMRLKEENND